jgi:glutamate dehydrogenase
MLKQTDHNDTNPLTAVFELIQKRLPADVADLATNFTKNFYERVSAEDLAERSTQDLYGAALSHWHFASRFTPGASRLRVYNPRPEEHGWQSTHTIIEIISQDMPFLVDSITMEVNRQGLTVHLIIHPLMRMRRDSDGNLQAIVEIHDEAAGTLESIIHVEVDRRTDPAHLEALQQGLARILADVHAAVADWPGMRQNLTDLVTSLEASPPPIEVTQVEEDIAFLKWLAAGNFTMLGYREYALVDEISEETGDSDCVLRIVPGTGAGILRETGEERSISFSALPPEVKKVAIEPRLLVLTKANARSTVHRPGYLDYVGVKKMDKDGKVIGEHRFLGLFTATAYSASPEAIPILRQKVRNVLDRAELRPHSHGGRALSIILEQYPRDELFQITSDQLYTVAMGILGLGERQRTRLFVRHDTFGRFYSCLIYAPGKITTRHSVSACRTCCSTPFRAHRASSMFRYPNPRWPVS